MAATYKFYKNPPKVGEVGKQELHARIVPKRTVDIEVLSEEISQQSSFSPADVKGMLEAFTSLINTHLKNGDNVKMKGLGNYSVSLSCPKGITNEKQVRAESIHFKNVNFRCSTQMKSALKTMELERKSAAKKEVYSPEQRLQRILSYLRTNRTVTASLCMSLNQCSRYAVMEDLQVLITAEKVEKLGAGRNVLYLLRA